MFIVWAIVTAFLLSAPSTPTPSLMLAVVSKRVHVGVSDVSAWSLLHLYDNMFYRELQCWKS